MGRDIRVMLISDRAKEGVNFMNVQTEHMTNPWWNIPKADQIIGRGIRQGSQKHVPFWNEQSRVKVIYYASIFSKSYPYTIGDIQYGLTGKRKYTMQTKFYKMINSSNFDCDYNKHANQIECTYFDDDDIVENEEEEEKQVGGNDDEDDDVEIIDDENENIRDPMPVLNERLMTTPQQEFFEAVRSNNFESARQLLRNIRNNQVNPSANDGIAFKFAAAHGHLRMVRLLMMYHRADQDIINIAIQAAAEQGQTSNTVHSPGRENSAAADERDAVTTYLCLCHLCCHLERSKSGGCSWWWWFSRSEKCKRERE